MALPEIIVEIVGVIGHGSAMELVREMGGQNIFIPRGPGCASWDLLAQVIGEPSTGRLSMAMGGREVYIALCHKALKAARNRRMIDRYDELLRNGCSARQAVNVLVREARPISYRQVETIVNSVPQDESGMVQSELF